MAAPSWPSWPSWPPGRHRSLAQPLAPILLLAFCFAAAPVHASPLKNPHICGRPECVAGPKFAYAPNTHYIYDYTLQTSALFEGTSRNESILRVRATVDLFFLSACDGELRVENVTVWEGVDKGGKRLWKNDASQNFDAAVGEYPLRFSFHDGVIAEICPEAEETSWVLNYKRGILSAIQNSMRRFDVSHETFETDVNGICSTHYSLDRAEGTSLIILKKKDFASCLNRNKFHSVLQTTPYVFHSKYPNRGAPLVNSRGSCELTIDHHVYSKIDCHEAHVFEPFSNGQSGATTRLQQTLQLREENVDEAGHAEPVQRRTTLLFDHDLTAKPTSGELRASRDLLKTMCRLNDADVHPAFPDAFAAFLRTGRVLSYTALSQLYVRASSLCPSARRHLLAALPLLGSNAAVALMRDFMVRRAVPRETTSRWLYALAFLPRPDARTVSLLTPLLRSEGADAQHVLSVSSVVHTYCRRVGIGVCAQHRDVYEMVAHLETQLEKALERRQWTRPARLKTIVAVKALANMGLASAGEGAGAGAGAGAGPAGERLLALLRRGADEESAPLELRVACIEAHRRLPCEDTRPYFLELYRNRSADSELRIAAYLQVMRCPNYNVIKTIKHALHKEQVNQVGSFVWTHLKNLLKSSIPSRVELQGLLQERDLEKKFSSDARKFSNNFQGSVFFEEYNAGGNYESNLIFSPKSYIPRSAMLNLTVDLFGESVNIFEVSGRLEGFEHYVESFFGPQGPWSNRKVNDKINNVLKKVRFTRDTNDNLVDQVDDVLDGSSVIDNNFNYPKVSLGLKVFGNELSYLTLEGDTEVQAALNEVNPMRKLQQLLSGKEISYNSATMFLDADYVVPTGAGLPMKLNAFGTAATNFKMSGSLKTSNLLETGILDVTGNLRPSVAVNVVGSMNVDGYYASASIRLKTNLYTSSAVDAHIKVRGRRLVSVSFNLPKDKMELITAESELFVLRGEEEEYRQHGIDKNRVEKQACSWPALSKILGLNFCAGLQFPNTTHQKDAPGLLFSGPNKFSAAFHKADPTAKKYLLEYKWETSKENVTKLSLVFDTPGSAQKREMSARLNLHKDSNNLTLLIQSADVKYEALGKYKNTEDEKHISFELNVGGKKHVDMELSLKMEKIPNGVNYLPRLFLAINGSRVAEISGTLHLVEKMGVSQCDVNLEFQTRKLESKLRGYVQRSEATIETNLKLEYKFQRAAIESLLLKANFTNRFSKSYTRTEGSVQVESSAYPQYNFISSFRYQNSYGHFECIFEINYGLKINDPRNKLTLGAEFTFSRSYETTKINLVTRVTKPITDINLQFAISYITSGSGTSIRSAIRYATGKEIHIALDLKMPRSTLTFIEAKLNITLPSFVPMILDVKVQEKVPNEYNIDLTATWFSGHNITAKGLYQDKSTHKASSHNLKLFLKSPSFEEIAATYKYLRDETEIRVELQADHGNDKYYILLKHASPKPADYETYVEVRWKSEVYSLLTHISLDQQRQITAQLHLDRDRDIHFMLRSFNDEERKEASVEVKWDANRDPGQKIAAAVQFLHPEALNYSGYAMLSYPGQTLRGKYLFALKDSRCESLAQFEWSPSGMVQLILGAIYEYEDALLLALKTELLTPFENWKKKSLSARIRHQENLIHANASVHWLDEQNIALNLFGDYSIKEDIFSCELNASIVSTIPDVPSVAGSFSHKQDNEVYDTHIFMQHFPQRAVSIKSTWQLEEGEDSTNLTGRVFLESPYPRYQEGVLLCRMHISSDWDIKGAAELTLERRKYTFGINGYVKKLTDNMLVFNITTPIENYSKVTGRFGYSGERKHLVAKIKSPSVESGIEILFQFINTNNFNIRFDLATPIEFLQKALLIAKLDEQMVDFRCGWNNLMVGVFGQWHYVNMTDFEYCYKIYTPIEGFHENGVVAKLIKRDGLDFAIGLNMGKSKLGILVQGAPKPVVPADLKLAQKQLAKANKNVSDDDEEEEDYDDEEDAISWKGMIELDTFFHPTYKGTLEIDEKDTAYIVEATLTLPAGKAILHDEFDFVDYFTMTNKLHLKTPYKQMEEINSHYDFKIDLGVAYAVSLNVSLLLNKELIETGISVNYTFHEAEDNDLQTRSVCVTIFSPFPILKFYKVQGMLEVEDNTHHLNITMSTDTSQVTTAGYLQAEEGYTESFLVFGLTSPVYTVPQFRISGKKDTTSTPKTLELLLEKIDPFVVMYKTDVFWNFESNSNFLLGGKFHAPYKNSPPAEVNLSYLGDLEKKYVNLNVLLSPAPQHKVKINLTSSENHVNAELNLPIENYREVIIDGHIQSTEDGFQHIHGNMKNDNMMYSLNGSYLLSDSLPIKLHIEVSENNEESVISLHADIEAIEKGYNMSCRLQNRGESLELLSGWTMGRILVEDFFLKATSTHPVYSMLSFRGGIHQTANGNVSVAFHSDTSIPGYKKFKFIGSAFLDDHAGEIRTAFGTMDMEASCHTEWIWHPFENMLLAVDGSFKDKEVARNGSAKIFFQFPRPAKGTKHITLGLGVKLDENSWEFGSNASITLSAKDGMEVQAYLILPPPQKDVHSMFIKLKLTETFDYINIRAKYATLYSRKLYGIITEVNIKKEDIYGNLQIEYGPSRSQNINNILRVKRSNSSISATYVLSSPLYEENTFKATASYDTLPEFSSIRAHVFCPETVNITQVLIDFKNLRNMNGTLVSRTPYPNLHFAGINFKAASNLDQSERFVEVFWPNNTALFDSKNAYKSHKLTTDLKGYALVEVPLATRHTGKINYEFKEEPLSKTGNAEIIYNHELFLEGNYKCNSESSAGFEKDKIMIELENKFFPLGIFYIHEFRYSGGYAGSNLPTQDIKTAEIFKLRNKTVFHLTGELAINSTQTGQEIMMTAKHLERVVQLKTDYDTRENDFQHRATLTLDPSSWASYDIIITNKTTDDKEEEHVEFNFAYPERNFTVVGYYQLANNSFFSELNFMWNKEEDRRRSFGTSLDWKRLSVKPNKQHAVFSIKHPTFIRDITLNGMYFSDDTDLMDISSDLVYSDDLDKKLVLSAKLQNLSAGRKKKYKYQIIGVHPATSLDLNVKGELQLERGLYQTKNDASYEHSYSLQNTGELNGIININKKEIDFEKITQNEVFYLRGKYSGKYPVYVVNGTMQNGGLSNSTGIYYFNLDEKVLFVSVNTTEDLSDRYFYIDGSVPDSRNVIFNVWTDYDDIKITDMIFYLRLNHSRLITSELRWRPELERQIKEYIKQRFNDFGNGIRETVSYWKNYIQAETCDIVKDIWNDAQPIIQGFLEDIEELKTLKADFENFKVYLNESYNNNDFYIQDIVSYCNKLMDDLSIRGHIQSLPAFIREIWEIMGESSEAILKSIRWIIDTIKNSYQKAMDFINSLMRGELTSKITDLMTGLGEKIDKFMKDMHVAFMKHVNDLYYKASVTLAEHWNRFVITVEPTFVTFAHYVETILWTISNKIVDFLYQTKSELAEYPYFTKFANFTQDLDRFYKDIMKNDIITNIRKYSKLVYEFIRAKYFAMVPFGKELEDVANEIIAELKVLQQLPSIKYIIEKVNELYEKVEWFYNYFQIGTRLQKTITLIHLKITDITQTALQAENRYREAKTLFIFDPENGIVVLEQKLPMSWHAFNETPRFEEIPEYKTISDIQSYFISSNITFWTLYYEYKPYTEPSNWLPPFSAQAIIAGPQHFMTFDRSFYEFHGSCSYLAASDFVDRNFSVVITYNESTAEHVVSVIIEKHVVNIDMFNDVVALEADQDSILPLQVGNTYVYQEASVVTLESGHGFQIQCNLKFDVCVISLSGWYFGKTAGLLGTMDNEPTSDFLSPVRQFESDVGMFAHSWALDNKTCQFTNNHAIIRQANDEALNTKCNEFFKMKSSQFSSCFSRVDSTPFLNMCLNSRNATNEEPCTVAVAYMQACMVENTPLRIPESCVKCQYSFSGEEVQEGNFQELKENEVERSTDIVFIIEAGRCNTNITYLRSLDILISSLTKELSASGFVSNRFSLVVFGGDGVYSKPRSVVVNNNVFANSEDILKYFEGIPTGDGEKDIFGAIRYASQLSFRAGVSKTFILLPCSNCDPMNMTLDYSVLHQVLLETGIKLHILMNDEFRFEKPKTLKMFYGIDRETAYTSKDAKELKGDSDVRRQVRLPKAKLGVCTALALETNGTVFTGKRLEGDKKNSVKKFATVFAKRIAQTASPPPCQKCECTADNNGMSYMECFPCEYPQPPHYSFNFGEEIDDSASFEEEFSVENEYSMEDGND